VDKAAGKVCEIGAEQLLYVFDPKTNQRSEFFKSVESAIEQGEDLSKFFGKEMGPEERRKAKDEALAQGKDDYLKIMLINQRFSEAKNYIEREHLLSALNQYNDDNHQNLRNCIEAMKVQMRLTGYNVATIDKYQHNLTFKKNQEGYLCVIDFWAEKCSAQRLPVREMYAVKVLEPSFASYIKTLSGYCFKKLTEQEKSHSYSQSTLGILPPAVGKLDSAVRLSPAFNQSR